MLCKNWTLTVIVGSSSTHSHGARFVHDGLVEEVSAPGAGGLALHTLLQVHGQVVHDGVAVGEVDADGLEVEGVVRQREPPCENVDGSPLRTSGRSTDQQRRSTNLP